MRLPIKREARSPRLRVLRCGKTFAVAFSRRGGPAKAPRQARLHLDKIGAKLIQLSDKQPTYLGIPVSGSHKPEQYRD